MGQEISDFVFLFNLFFLDKDFVCRTLLFGMYVHFGEKNKLEKK